MEVEKKSYVCSETNCSMIFLNKDHLYAHKQKHGLCLSLTPSTPFKNMFLDETPTPTRFLNALESEVFQELNINPFDATFRKANSNNAGGNTFVIPDSSSLIASLPDSEVLNTPSITLPSLPGSPIIFKHIFTKKPSEKVAVEDTTDTLPFTPDNNLKETEVVVDNQPDCVPSSTSSNSNMPPLEAYQPPIVVEPPVAKLNPPPRMNVVQMPVITSAKGMSIIKPSTTGVPTAVVVTRPTSNVQNISLTPKPAVTEKPTPVKVPDPQPPQAVVQSVCVTPMVQVMIRLPDGQTMPVQFPVMQTVPTAPALTAVQVPTVQLAQSTITTLESQLPSSSTTKMKLKEVLTTNQKSGNINRNISSNLNIQNKPVTQTIPSVELLAEFGISPPSSPIAPVLRPGHNGRKRRDSFSDSPDVKRVKSLERNRAAATRCREKRKVWITALEKKAEELESTNSVLQHEVSQLRNEVAHLKTMLLAHKDCPVTLQQKGMAYETVKDSYTTIHIINATSDDLQRVPNSSIVSSLTAEFLETEISSIQSSSDASLTSDASDASFKER